MIRVQNATAAPWLAAVGPALTAAAAHSDERVAADLVGAVLRSSLPSADDILTPAELDGSSERYQQHLLARSSKRDFSVVALVWRPGQSTTIHDHLCWGAIAVLIGEEHEQQYELIPDNGPGRLRLTGTSRNRVGSVSTVAPPGDIHLVANRSGNVAVSLHVYGADIRAGGSSIRRNYAHAVPSVRGRPALLSAAR